MDSISKRPRQSGQAFAATSFLIALAIVLLALSAFLLWYNSIAVPGWLLGLFAAVPVSLALVYASGKALKKHYHGKIISLKADLESKGRWSPEKAIKCDERRAFLDLRDILVDEKRLLNYELLLNSEYDSSSEPYCTCRFFRTSEHYCTLRRLYKRALHLLNGGSTLNMQFSSRTFDNWEQVSIVFLDNCKKCYEHLGLIESFLDENKSIPDTLIDDDWYLDMAQFRIKRAIGGIIELLSVSHAILGQHAEAHRLLRLGLKLANTGGLEPVLMKLGQLDDIRHLLGALRLLQQLHAGTVHEWEKTLDQLESMDSISPLSGFLRSEADWIYRNAVGICSDTLHDVEISLYRFQCDIDWYCPDIPECLLTRDLMEATALRRCRSHIIAVHEFANDLAEECARHRSDPSRDCKDSIIFLSKWLRNRSGLYRHVLNSPPCASIEVDYLAGFVDCYGSNQLLIHAARNAAVLERHRLLHGKYPDSLSRVDGSVFDEAGGIRMRYECTDGMSYVLQYDSFSDCYSDLFSGIWSIRHDFPDVSVISKIPAISGIPDCFGDPRRFCL